jgi:60 kDa SS-A/Ro ribonucleoprotein
MKLNVAQAYPFGTTAEGGKAARNTPELELRRLSATCMLWEDGFYIDGQTIAQRIKHLVSRVKPEFAAAVAADARGNQKLRHLPLLIVREMARLPDHKKLVGRLLPDIIMRADEITEFLAIWQADDPKPLSKTLSKQAKLGLAKAFLKFDEYALAKYDREGKVRLRDALFLCHAKPDSPEREALWKRLIDGKMATPDTWEVRLSKGENKAEAFMDLMNQKKLGGLAFLRNLRNMAEGGVPHSVIRDYAQIANFERVLPFRFIAAARMMPQFEPILEPAMLRAVQDRKKLKGRTVLLVDVSGSMQDKISSKSDLTRLDAAKGLAMLLREQCEDIHVFTFENHVAHVPPRRGFALGDAIGRPRGGTNIGFAVHTVGSQVPHDRMIVLTDEQSHDTVGNPAKKGYMINVASNRQGVGTDQWHRVFGWSEAIVDYMQVYEELES